MLQEIPKKGSRFKKQGGGENRVKLQQGKLRTNRGRGRKVGTLCYLIASDGILRGSLVLARRGED
ncbi:CRAL-TRIO domain-containing protein [Psidium guajava]|nr:CRAL-TRIO domain-containing protein [Psidium guajava]